MMLVCLKGMIVLKILLITQQYPGYINQSKIEATYVVHYFAREWAKNNEVQVIRLWPYYPKIFNWFKKSKTMNMHAFEEKFNIEGVLVRRIPILKIPRINYTNINVKMIAKKIMNYIYEQFTPDVIICDIINPSIYIGHEIAKKNNSLLVASLHNSDIRYLSKKRNFKFFMDIEQDIDKIIFRSNKVEQNYLKLYTGDRKESDYSKIFFGIDKNEIIDMKKLKEKLLNTNKTIMIASSLKKLKKVDILIKAFSEIENKNGYVLKIIGDGPERQTLENLVEHLHCKSCIQFKGEKKREEVLTIMEQSDIFVMVSSPETFGLVYIEAMGKGCITIGSKGEGIDGVIINDENGYLCIPDDVNNLRVTLEKAINLSINEKEKMAKNAIAMTYEFCNDKLASDYLSSIT